MAAPPRARAPGDGVLPSRVLSVVFACGWLAVGGYLAATQLSGVTHPGTTTREATWLVLVVALVAFTAAQWAALRRRSRQLWQETADALDAVVEVAEPTLARLSRDEMVCALTERLRRAVLVDTCAALLVDPGGGRLRVVAAGGYAGTPDPHVPVEGVAGRVVSLGRAEVHVAEPADDLLGASAAEPVGALVAVPVRVRGDVLGVLQVTSRRRRRWRREELRLLDLVAARIGQAVDRSRLQEEERRARLGYERGLERLTVLVDTGDALAAAVDDPEPALHEVVASLVRSFVDVAAVVRLDDSFDLRPAVVLCHAKGASSSRPLSGDECTRLLEVTDLDGSLLLKSSTEVGAPLRRLIGEPDIDSAAVVPIRSASALLGLLVAATKEGTRGLRPLDVTVLDEIAKRVALALERRARVTEARQTARDAQRRATQLRRLSDASLAINGSLSLPHVMELTVANAREVTDARAAQIRVQTPTGEVHVARTALDDDAEDLRWTSATFNSPATGWSGTLAVGIDSTGDEHLLDLDEHAALTLLVEGSRVALENAYLYESVEANEARLTALVEASPMAMLEVGVDLQMVRCNTAATELFGGGDLLHEEFLASDGAGSVVVQLTRLALDAIGPVHQDVEIKREDGTVAFASLTAEAIHEPGGAPSSVLVMGMDLTEQRRLQEQFEQAQRLETAGRLAGGIAHDFNNLLTIILGYAESLLGRLEDGDPLQRPLTAIQRSAKRAAALTAQLLTISRRQVSNPVAVRLDELVQGMHDAVARMVGESVQLSVDAAAGAVILIDPHQFEQLLLNLVTNARDAMPGGGRIVIRTGRTPEGHAALEVEDTGAGMDAETLAHCMEPFFTTKPQGKGTGLGLSAVYGIARQHDGHVRITSAPGTGTTVAVLFPVLDDAAVTAEHTDDAAAESVPRARSGEHLLLVEDDAEVRALSRLTLEGLGYIVLEAENGLRALDFMTRYDGPLHLMVTDVVMPGMSGGELTGRIRMLRPGLPVLYVSAYTDSSPDDLDAPDVRAAFLAKPFELGELARVVRRTIDREG